MQNHNLTINGTFLILFVLVTYFINPQFAGLLSNGNIINLNYIAFILNVLFMVTTYKECTNIRNHSTVKINCIIFNNNFTFSFVWNIWPLRIITVWNGSFWYLRKDEDLQMEPKMDVFSKKSTSDFKMASNSEEKYIKLRNNNSKHHFLISFPIFPFSSLFLFSHA